MTIFEQIVLGSIVIAITILATLRLRRSRGVA